MGLEVSLKALGEVTFEVEGVLEGVGVLSDSSESFNSCDLPLHILNTIGGFGGSVVLVLFTFELKTVFSGGLLFEEKNLRGELALVVLSLASYVVRAFLVGLG